VCPFYYTGLIGLGLFVVIFYFQPNILNFGENQSYTGIRNFFASIARGVLALVGLLRGLRKWLSLERVQTAYSYIAEYAYALYLMSV
jgi:hypothetical protein